MGRSKVRRSLSVDGDVSRDLDRLAEALGFSASSLATKLIREGIQRRHQQIESMAYAGIGIASLALVALVGALW